VQSPRGGSGARQTPFWRGTDTRRPSNCRKSFCRGQTGTGRAGWKNTGLMSSSEVSVQVSFGNRGVEHLTYLERLIGSEQISPPGTCGASNFGVSLSDHPVQHCAEDSRRLVRTTRVMIVKKTVDCEAPVPQFLHRGHPLFHFCRAVNDKFVPDRRNFLDALAVAEPADVVPLSAAISCSRRNACRQVAHEQFSPPQD
jgi:hypothetical protein